MPVAGSLPVQESVVVSAVPSPLGEKIPRLVRAAIDGGVVSTVIGNARPAWLPAGSQAERVAV